ncbi:hypothetical protein NIES593_13190 [Hydrococcus rivularis NIES-593]|uniref:PEP-CTERM protein-sorting domain-containing protein n=1 Tax=Hydrococcus rivularis NIES-593 TaxID=1921803 RepID=A0A1U7HEX6_9CYAN|nr:hypothetical protein [Hydrococcus rivularis]OKH22152.1 hypothetical protein NIES593_13190 [Hydrococcus rivularis NIES-593]
MNNAAVAISSALVGVALNVLPAQAVTFKDVTQGILTFEVTGFSSYEPEIPITGQGTFEYSSEPIEGTFVLLSNGEFLFFNDPNDIPNPNDPANPLEFYLMDSLYIDRTQNLHFIKNVDISFSLGSRFSYTQTDLTSGSLSLYSTLLFEPPGSSSFPPGSGGLYSISGNDPRFTPSSLLFEASWFLGYPLGADSYQLSLSNNGTVFGIVSDNLPNIVDFDGTWTAEAIDSSQPPTVSVPEPQPLVMLGASAALGVAVLSKRKPSKNKY